MADLPGIASMEKHELKNKYRDWAILPEFDSPPIHIFVGGGDLHPPALQHSLRSQDKPEVDSGISTASNLWAEAGTIAALSIPRAE
jgi:hypothetical protein